MPVDEARGHTMAHVVRQHFDPDARTLNARIEFQTFMQHVRLAAGEPMAAEAPRITVDAALAGCDVRQRSGRGHVAGLALLPAFAGRTGQPFGVGAVSVLAEQNAFMARRTIAT